MVHRYTVLTIWAKIGIMLVNSKPFLFFRGYNIKLHRNYKNTIDVYSLFGRTPGADFSGMPKSILYEFYCSDVSKTIALLVAFFVSWAACFGPKRKNRRS